MERYAAREGHTIIHRNLQEEGFDLIKWVSRQRRNRDTLSLEQIHRLEQIPGWVWSDLATPNPQRELATLKGSSEQSGHLANNVDDLNRCYECGVALVDTESYFGADGKPWCKEHGPDGVGGPE
jgi:hypothetical protein